MDHIILRCIIWCTGICNILMEARGLTPCPKACRCDHQKMTVDCPYGYWDKLPDIPQGTNHLKITSKFGSFTQLTKPSSCAGYSELNVLDLRYDGIEVITEDAFMCMPKLKQLTIDSILTYDLRLATGVFQHVSELQTVHIRSSFQNLEMAMTELCKAKRLEKITIAFTQHIIPESFKCIGSLEYLYHIEISDGPIHGSVTEILYPLRNVSKYVSISYAHLSFQRNDSLSGFKTETLRLPRNDIVVIARHTFTNMTNLKELDLSYNYIHNISRYTFVNLPNLKRLNLSHNRVLYISEYAFTNGPKFQKLADTDHPGEDISDWIIESSLEEIDLSHNPLKEIPPLPRGIQQLKLSNCLYLNFSVYGHVNFQLPNLTNLEVTGVNGHGLVNLIRNLANCPHLRILSLSGGVLPTLNQTLFNPFKPAKLEVLLLHNSEISGILPRTFQNFANLQVLDLSKNMLSEVSQDMFVGLTSLISLDLSHNSFQRIQPNVFLDLKQIGSLFLQNNKLTFIPPNTFSNLLKLKLLDLGHNSLDSFDPIRIGLHDSLLTDLKLDGNKINYFNIINLLMLAKCNMSHNRIQLLHDISNLTSLMHLDLSYNAIDKIPKCTMPANLSFLDLSGNDFQDPNWIELHLGHTKHLEILNISWTPVGDLSPAKLRNIWAKLYELKFLRLNNCRIQSLYPRMFSTLVNLKILHASSNYISSIDPLAFGNGSQVQELYIDRNRITSVNWNSFTSLPNLQFLYIAYNPILCTCDVLWILQAIRTPHLVYIIDHSSLLCQSPLNVQNDNVKDLDLDVSSCENQWLDVVKPIAAVLSSALVLVGIYILWYYRWHIRYTIFLAKAGRGRYEEMHDGHEYIYDAFVAYSGEDLSWVKEQLLPNIDSHYVGPGGYKLCIHHRDWLAGVDIVENIVKSIAESRRTILVLSKEFAASYWCRFELAIAHMQLDAEGHKRDRLMVILLDDIPTRLITPRLKHILTTKTYLTWPLDPPLQPFFWKTLHKSLKKKHFYEANKV